MSMRLLPCLFVASLLLACEGATVPPDGSITRDAMVGDSGGLLDGGGADAAAFVDAGSEDAGPAWTCDVAVCDPRATDECGATGACVLTGEAPMCVDGVVGTLGVGAECAAPGDCLPGLACFDEGGRGVCERICCPGDGGACAVGSRCGGSGRLVDGVETGWGRCLALRSCDVLAPEMTCEPREGCYIIETTSGQTECRVAGSAGPGDPCAAQEDCQAGFFCGGVGGSRCVRICSVVENDCPPEEGRCVAQAHTPDGAGLCTMDAMSIRMRY